MLLLPLKEFITVYNMYVYCGQSTAAASNMAAVVEARDKYAAVMNEVRARVCVN